MAITLNGIQEKVRALEGKSRATPIRMSDLNNRINILEQKGNICKLVFSKVNQILTIPTGYENAEIYYAVQAEDTHSSYDNVQSVDSRGNMSCDVTLPFQGGRWIDEKGRFERSGNTITLTITRTESIGDNLRSNIIALCVKP